MWPDEAEHFIIGAAIHDLLVRGAFAHPIRVVEEFYRPCPNVTLGQWPPVLYLIKALWAAVAGGSRDSFLALAVLVTAAAAAVVYRVARPVGRVAAAPPRCSSSLARRCSCCSGGWEPTCSSCSWARPSWRCSPAAFGTGAAVMRSATGCSLGSSRSCFALFLLSRLVVVLAGRWRTLREPDLWLAGPAAVGLCLLWYWLTAGRFSSSFQSDAGVGLVRYGFTARAADRYWTDLTANFDVAGILVPAGAARDGHVWCRVPRTRADRGTSTCATCSSLSQRWRSH